MAALSDTPTPPIPTSEADVSIKLEQGVLSENEYGSVYHNTERQGIPNIKYDSIHPPISMENGSSNSNLYNISHSIFQSDIEIKSEPPVDIDDTYNEGEGPETTSFNSYSQKSPIKHYLGTLSPLIRLTPTCKLMSPNASAGTPNKKRYECPYEHCTKSYGKSSHLRSHLTWHTGIKPFVCQEADCGKGFTRSDELNRHIRTHTGEKPFECVQCTKKFSRSDHLTKHLATHSKQLAENNRKKVRLENLVLARAARAKIEEPDADSPLVISSVSENVENNIDFSEGMPAADSPLVSSSVNEKVENHIDFSEGMHSMAKRRRSTSEDLTDEVKIPTIEHMKIKLEKPDNSDEYQAVSPQKQENNTASTPLVTPVMSNIKTEAAEFSVKDEPMDESEDQYENEPDDDAIMPEANLPPLLSSVGAESIITPLNPIVGTVYDPTRPFPCSQCPKCFKRQDDLNRHIRTHTGEKPFACNECEKRFMRSDHLKKHLNTHTRDAPKFTLVCEGRTLSEKLLKT